MISATDQHIVAWLLSIGGLALALGVSEWRASRDAIDAVLAPVKIEVA